MSKINQNTYVNFSSYLQDNASLSEDTIHELLPFCKIQNLTRGEILLAEGAMNRHFYFVESGLIRLYSISRDGREHVLQFAPENWWLSDRNHLRHSEPSAYFIDAIEDSSVVLLDQDFINRALSVSNAFSLFHEDLLQRHINQLYRRINLLIGATATERYHAFLSDYPNIFMRVPQWMVASYIGITPEALSRIRSQRQ